MIFSVLFQFANANPDGFAVRTAARLTCASVPPFRCGETSGVSRCGARLGNNAVCGRLHLIRFAALSTFPSRGRLFYCRQPKRLSLEEERNSPLPLGRFRRMKFQFGIVMK